MNTDHKLSAFEDIHQYVQELGKRAKLASQRLNQIDSLTKNRGLLAIAQGIEQNRELLLKANQQDVETATRNNQDSAFIDRLKITPNTIQTMVEGLKQVASLPDPIGQILQMNPRPSGITIGQIRVPLGVIGIIYESRPNVTIDAAALCLKSGNACILRGGSESIHSNQILAKIIHDSLASCNIPTDAVQIVATPDRAAVGALITLTEYVDIIVPRGGKSLIARLMSEATVPMIKHLDGICHVYIDEYADLHKAIKIALNAKTHRYGTCNTMETLLVHSKVAADLLPQLAKLYWEKSVQLRVDSVAMRILKPLSSDSNNLLDATEEDWHTEYLAPILSIKIVNNISEAVDHINFYGSHHTDAIITEHLQHSQIFIREVDSASVMVNASTRFADGFEYGLGAEIGISNDKLHARGPVGLEGLTSLKYVVMDISGQGAIRQ